MKHSFVIKARILGYLFRPILAFIGMASVMPFTWQAVTYAQTPGWSLTGSLNTSRYLPTATLLPNGKVLVAGGSLNGAPLNSAELYDPAVGTWSFTGSLNMPRYLHTATLLPNGKVLVVGGVDVSNLTSAELYDPSTGTWSFTGGVNLTRFWHTATLLQNGKVLVVGGASAPDDSAELYDPSTGTWSMTGSVHTGRYGHTATLLQSGLVLIAGGSDDGDLDSALASAELYDPVTGTWSVTGSLHEGRLSTAVLLPNGKVLVAGGYTKDHIPDGSGFYSVPISLRSAELYDPATGTWSSTSNLNEQRSFHTATLLPSGKVLVAAGLDWGTPAPCPCSATKLDSAELYDPIAGTWQRTANLKRARSNQTATLLESGNVLVATGDDSNRSVEIYNDGQSGLLTLLTSTLPNAEAGVAYTAPLVNDGVAPYSTRFIKGALPPGLFFDANSGVISGTPTSAVNRTFKIQVTDQNGLSGTGTLSIKVIRALAIKSGALKVGVNGRAYRATLSAVGGDKPYHWSLVSGNLPSGLALDNAIGAVAGMPTENGTFNLKFRLSDPIGGMTERDISLKVR
jgi:hypothetical protein